MLNKNKGSINSKQNRRLFFLNKLRKKKINQIEEQEIKRKNTDKASIIYDKKERKSNDNKNVQSIDINIDKVIDVKHNNDSISKENINNKNNNAIYSKKKTVPIIKPNLVNIQTNELNISNEKIKNSSLSKYNTINPIDKKEISKTEDFNNIDSVVKYEFKTILDNKLTELNELVLETKYLSNKTQDEVEIDELIKIEKQFNELIEQIEKIKFEINSLTDSATFKNIHKLNNIELINLIDKYKNTYQKTDILNQLDKLEHSELYSNIVKKLIIFETEQNYLENTLNDKKKKYSIRDQEFEEWKDNYFDIEKVIEPISDMINESEKQLIEIEEKVNKAVTVTEVIETKIRSSLGIVSKTLLIMSLLKKNANKNTKISPILQTAIALDLIDKIIKPKKEIEKHYKTDIVDYKNTIISALNDVKSIDSIIDTSLNSINNLKTTFQKEFSDYQNYIPEYLEFLDKLNKLEKEMISKKDNIQKISTNLDIQYNKNKQKVKKYENLRD